jgi:hypothetical protein
VKALLVAHTVFCEPVDVRGKQLRVAGDGQGVRALIVGEQEDDVGTRRAGAGFLGTGRGRSGFMAQQQAKQPGAESGQGC